LRGRKLLALVGALAALALVGVGCGGDDDGGGDQSSQGGGSEQGGTIKVGFLSDCEGDFGSFFEPTISGAHLALIR
jgi:branched-chain amino acid transport system substrate-binding protein